MSDIRSIIDIKNEQQSVEILNKSLSDLAKRLDEIPARIKPLTSEFDMLAQVSRTIESIRMAQYFTGVTNSALETAKSLNGVYKSQRGLIGVGTSLLGVLGGPLGLAITLGTLAASFITMAASSDIARQKFLSLDDELDTILNKYKKLNAIEKVIFKYELDEEKNSANDKLNATLERNRKLFVNGGVYNSDFASEAGGLGEALGLLFAKPKGGEDSFNKLKAVISSNNSVDEKTTQIQTLFNEFVKGGSITSENAKHLQNTLLHDLNTAVKEQNKVTEIDGIINNPNETSGQKKTNNTSLETLLNKQKEQCKLTLKNNQAEQEYLLLLEKRQSLLQSIADSKLTPLDRLDQEYSSKKELLQGGIDENNPLSGPLSDEVMEEMLARKQQYEEALTDIETEYSEKRKQIIDDENEARIQATIQTLDSSSQLFGSLGQIIGAFGGESSNAYKAMFAMSKGFSIASATLSLYDSIAKAMGKGFPENIPLMAQAAAQGAQLISSIKGTNLSGQAHSGIDYIPREGTWLLDKGERVVDARTNTDLKNFLQSSNQGKSGLSVNVPVTISGGDVSEEEGKQLGTMIKQSVMSVIQEQQRPGGILNRH